MVSAIILNFHFINYFTISISYRILKYWIDFITLYIHMIIIILNNMYFPVYQRFKLMERCVNFFEISLYIPKFENVKCLYHIFMAYLLNLQNFLQWKINDYHNFCISDKKGLIYVIYLHIFKIQSCGSPAGV